MTARIVSSRDGQIGLLGSIGVRFMIDGKEVSDRFSLVEHPISPHALAAPLHRHTREEEYSFVVRGRMGALLGDEVVFANPGDLIVKPRNQWHTFWNAGDDWASILEIISPAGFDRFFHELGRHHCSRQICTGRPLLSLWPGYCSRNHSGLGPAFPTYLSR
ncbi:MAG TPA: cupin domain-containing protein [Terriglobales bacterium]|nr:cupin domain-containing protein [Terriglobales bacterium]